MAPDSPYPGELQATSGNLKAILDQLFGIKIRDVDRDIEDVPSLHGDLWLDNDGCLNPEIAKEYQERLSLGALPKVDENGIKSCIEPAIRSRLGKRMRVSLLGKNTENERLYLHEALVRLAEGHHPASWAG
ncbi:hypothetical protein WJX84_004351 [Apatococcus fuscideae]|uniref:Uncharacterized protein n=1 Tax=Apatococcus fuscideae TaxID=2026836 RepID=A0AAW1T8C4_9CHLO